MLKVLQIHTQNKFHASAIAAHLIQHQHNFTCDFDYPYVGFTVVVHRDHAGSLEQLSNWAHDMGLSYNQPGTRTAIGDML